MQMKFGNTCILICIVDEFQNSAKESLVSELENDCIVSDYFFHWNGIVVCLPCFWDSWTWQQADSNLSLQNILTGSIYHINMNIGGEIRNFDEIPRGDRLFKAMDIQWENSCMNITEPKSQLRVWK